MPEAAPPPPPTNGVTDRSASIEPMAAAAPPAAPSTGYTYRSYSYQPATTYYQSAPYYRSYSSASADRPQDQIINRRLHAGRYTFNNP
jgi:hypothetical protein